MHSGCIAEFWLGEWRCGTLVQRLLHKPSRVVPIDIKCYLGVGDWLAIRGEEEIGTNKRLGFLLVQLGGWWNHLCSGIHWG